MANKKTKIFLVDDDPMHLQMLHDHLEQMSDFEIKSFGTGEECIKYIQEKKRHRTLFFSIIT